MKKILVGVGLLIPMVSFAESSVDMMQEQLAKKDRWDKQDYAKIGLKQAGAECKADISKQSVEIDPAWKGGSSEDVRDAMYKLSVKMAQTDHLMMFEQCMEAKGWKFRRYTKEEYQQLEKQYEQDKQKAAH